MSVFLISYRLVLDCIDGDLYFYFESCWIAVITVNTALYICFALKGKKRSLFFSVHVRLVVKVTIISTQKWNESSASLQWATNNSQDHISSFCLEFAWKGTLVPFSHIIHKCRTSSTLGKQKQSWMLYLDTFWHSVGI